MKPKPLDSLKNFTVPVFIEKKLKRNENCDVATFAATKVRVFFAKI